MAAEASIEDIRQQGTTIKLSPAAKMGIMLSLDVRQKAFPGLVEASIHDLTLAGPDYAYLHEGWHFFASADGQRYLQSDELRMTLASLAGAGLEAVLEAAFDESRGQLVFRGTFPRPEFLQKLVEKFVTSANPRSFRRVLLISDEDQNEATSASFHLPRAYDTSFPCSRCSGHRTLNETYPMLVEVFHFRNRNDPSVCATVSFRMPSDHNTSWISTPDSRVEVYLTESCRPQRAPFSRPSRKLLTQFDTFYDVLRATNPDGLEKLQAVSRGWCAIIDRHKRALPRRKLLVYILFAGEDPAVVTVFVTRWNGEHEQVLRALVPHDPEQLSRMLHTHLRDALVKLEFFSFKDSFWQPPQDALLRYDHLKSLGWAIRLFQSLGRTQVERVKIDSELFRVHNFPALMKAARFSCRVGTFDLNHPSYIDALTVRQVVDLLRDPTAAASDKIVVQTVTPVSTDYSMVEDVLFSRTTPAFEFQLDTDSEIP